MTETEIKYQERIVKANMNICNILGIDEFVDFLEDSNVIHIIKAFYIVNKPDIYKMHISTSANITTVNIQNSIMGSTVSHSVSDDFAAAILLAVSQFIEYQGQEYRPV